MEHRQDCRPGLLGLRPSRHFKIYRQDFPAIFRFNGKLYEECFDDYSQVEWREISEDGAIELLNRGVERPQARTDPQD